MKRAVDLKHKIYETTDPQQRFAAIAETFANLTVVAKTWPNDRNAVIRSALMQADLGLEWNIAQNTIAALTPVLPLVSKTALEPGVERRLGEAYERLNRLDAGEEHLLAAEHELHNNNVNNVEAEGTLDAIAHFYLRRNKPREAIKRIHAVIDLPGQDPLNKAMFALAGLKAALAFNDDPGHTVAAQEFLALNEHIYNARRSNPSPQNAALLESVVKDAERLKAMHHF